MPRPFAVIGFTVFFTIAILYDMKTGVTAAVFAAFTVALVVALFLDKARKNKIIPTVAASGAIACILLFSAEIFVYQPALEHSGRTCEIKAVLTSECEERYGNYYYEARALTVDGENSDMKLRFTFSTPVEAVPYDLVEGKFEIFTLGSSDEDYMLSHKANGLFMGAYSYSEEFEVTTIPESDKPFAKKILDFRAAIKNAVYRILPDNRGALAVALIIGDKSGISDDVMDDFNDIGITHLICVSGFHLSLWSFLILKILRKTGMNEKLANAFAIVGVIGFMLVAGLSYSVMRSGIMMLVYLIANIISRKRDSLNSLGFALTVIALYNPFAMGAAGLQLSALATLGLILYFQFFGEKIKNFFDKINPKILGKGLRYVCDAFLTTAAATAFILPVTLRINSGFHFGIFLANPVAIPVSEACIILCVLGAVVGLIPFSFINIPAFAGGFFVSFLMQIAEKTADLNFLSVKTDDDTIFLILAGLSIIVIMSLFMWKNKKSMPELTCILCAVYFTFSMFIADEFIERETRINIVDCGNGTSVIIGTEGENYLFGCGGTDFLGSARLLESIEFFGGELEAVIIPDASEYNAGWFIDIVKTFSPEKVWCGKLPDGTKYLLNSAEINEFEALDISDNVSISGKQIDGSSCAVFENGDISVLICFDPIDFELIKGRYDIVVSRNDYPDGIQNEDCRLAVISANGERGRILSNELAEKGIRTVVTGGEGNIIIRASDGAVSINRKG